MKSTRVRLDQDEASERTILAYLYDAKTHEYAGIRAVHGEHIAGGGRAYLLRPHETLAEPPIVEEGEAAVFIERTGGWAVKRYGGRSHRLAHD